MNISRIFDFPYHQNKKYKNPNSFFTKINDEWIPTTSEEYINLFNKVSKSLLKLGIKKGDAVGIISTNRREWNIAEMGISQIGAFIIPIYPTVTETSIEYIINHSETKVCFVENAEILKKVELIKKNCPTLSEIYSFDIVENCPGIDEFYKIGESVKDESITEISQTITNEDIATILYTSGTTGMPKGVILTHNNLVSNTLDSVRTITLDSTYKALTFLPVSHIFERIVLFIYQYFGIPIYFAQSLETISVDAKDVKPSVMTVVPRLLEKVYDAILDKGKDLTGIKKNLFFWAVGLGLRYKPFENNGFWYSIQLKIARKLIFKKWQEALGGEIQFMISGSAALRHDLIRVFHAAGMPVIEGYGLTESSPVISVGGIIKADYKFGTVGKPIHNVDVKIAKDGEILAKGPNIMKGYYKDPELTAKTINKDGYLCTGDIGIIDKDGFLKITDRKKEIFKTSGGKYIAPQVIEIAFKKSRFIDQLMVVGEGEKFPSAVILPEFIFLKEWAKRNDISFSDEKDLVKNKQVFDRIMKEVDKMNSSFGQWEKIKKIILTSDTWSIDTGELTPTMKLKRKVVFEKYKSEIKLLYT